MKRAALSLILLVLGIPALCPAETLQIDGSTTVGPIADAFAEYFMRTNPGLEITVKKTGSGDGAAVTKRIIEAAGGPVMAVIDLVNGTATARFAFGALRKGGKLVQVGLFGGELMLPLPIMAIRNLSVLGSYVGNPKELRELVKLAQEGTLEALPVATIPQNRADEALMRLRDGKVTGRLVLKAEAA